MILSTMNPLELCKEFSEIFEYLVELTLKKVVIPGRHKLLEIHKRTKKNVPLKPRDYEYRGNIFSTDGMVIVHGNYEAGIWLEFSTNIHNSKGIYESYRVVPDFENDVLFIFHMSNHFFKRYRERFLEDETIPIKEVIETFYANNPRMIVLGEDAYPDDYECYHKGEPSTAIKVRDGVCFSFMSDFGGCIFIDVSTFITDSMMREDQKFLGEVDDRSWLCGGR